MNPEILKLEATDKDGSKDFGDICRYEIVNENQPFEVSKEGIVYK